MTIKLDKAVLDIALRLVSFFSFFFGLITNPFLFKYFFISKIDNVFIFKVILQPLLLPQVNNDTKDFEHLALGS